MAVAKQRAKLDSTLLSAKNAAPAADLSVIRMRKAASPVVALADPGAAAPPVDGMFFKKGSASATTFRPTYWTYERRTDAPAPAPAPGKSALPGLELQLDSHKPLDSRKEPVARKAEVENHAPVASLFGDVSGEEILAQSDGPGSFPEAAVRREIVQRFRQPEVEALLRALAAERGESVEHDDSEADDNAEVLRVTVDEVDEAETAAPETESAAAEIASAPEVAATAAALPEEEPVALAPALPETAPVEPASHEPIEAAPEAPAVPLDAPQPVAETAPAAADAPPVETPPATTRSRRIDVDKISGRRRGATADAPAAQAKAPDASPGGDQLTAAIENVLASRWYGSEQRVRASEQQRGHQAARPTVRPDALQPVTPSSLIAELAAARRTIAPPPPPKSKSFVGLIAVAVLIVIGVAGYVGWTMWQDSAPPMRPTAPVATAATALPAQSSKPPVASPNQR